MLSPLGLPGKVRVALGLGTPALATKDPTSGEVRGPALELARALAAKLSVELELVEYPRPGAVLEGLRSNAWDVTFLVADASRAAEADFSPPYMQSDFTYLVPAGSALQTVADADQTGVRIAVPQGDASEIRLSQIIKHAELLRTDSIPTAVDMLRAGQADAYAAPRTVLLALSAQLSGSRVLPDGFAAIAYAALVPKGNPALLAAVSEFIDGAKASGLVQQTIDRAGLRGVQVSPAQVSP